MIERIVCLPRELHRAVLAVAFALFLAGCQQSSDSNTISCASTGAPASKMVGMVCAGTLNDVTERVEVVVGPPAQGSVAVRGFNFDVVYDPTKLEFVPDTEFKSPLFPDGLVAVALFNDEPGRVVVSIQQPGELLSVEFEHGNTRILGLSFRRVQGATFSRTPLFLQNGDATGATVYVGFVINNVSLSYP